MQIEILPNHESSLAGIGKGGVEIFQLWRSCTLKGKFLYKQKPPFRYKQKGGLFFLINRFTELSFSCQRHKLLLWRRFGGIQ